MNNADDEADFASLERRLKSRRGAEPSAGLQTRIMRAVAAELSSSPPSTRPRIGFLSFAAAMAASLLVAANLAVTLGSASLFDARPAIARQKTLDDASALRQLSPELSRSEAIRLSMLLHAGGHLTPLPDLRSPAQSPSAADKTNNNERNLQ